MQESFECPCIHLYRDHRLSHQHRPHLQGLLAYLNCRMVASVEVEEVVGAPTAGY